MALTGFSKGLIGLVLATGVFFGIKYGANHMGPSVSAEVPKTVAVAAMTAAPVEHVASAVTQLPLPSKVPAQLTVPQMRAQVMAWNSQMGLMLANGGPVTTVGSLMASEGANLQLIRENDCNKMMSSLTVFANELKTNPQPTKGVHFMVVMGDGGAAFLSGLNSQLSKLGKDYEAEIIAAAGFSNGEDGCYGPGEFKTNPQLLKGEVGIAVLRDGDWNIMLSLLGSNLIKNNPNETTWDNDAFNWIAVDDYIDAAQKFISGKACEERRVVSNGKFTGEKATKCAKVACTWTPGDVMIAHNKGGVIPLLTTKKNINQMPSTIIGIRKWDAANATEITGMIAAIGLAGDQIKSYPSALTKASEISAEVYKEETPVYWEKYFKGVTELDKTGVPIELGGSRVNNLADMVHLFGIAPGSINIYADVYTAFGDIVVQQYPKLVPNYPKAETIINTTYLQAAIAKHPTITEAEIPKYTGAPVANIVSKRNWSINFKTGSADFSPEALVELQKIRRNLVTSDLVVEIHGHTDNTGNPANNVTLSQHRANAVKTWLMTQSTSDFPSERFVVKGHGDTEPVADNGTDAGKAKNRRVVIIQGTN